MEPTALLPLRRKACWGIFRPKNPTASAGREPVNLGTKGQHATSRPPKPLTEAVSIKHSQEQCSSVYEFTVKQIALYLAMYKLVPFAEFDYVCTWCAVYDCTLVISQKTTNVIRTVRDVLGLWTSEHILVISQKTTIIIFTAVRTSNFMHLS
jgi:hypothetical protein